MLANRVLILEREVLVQYIPLFKMPSQTQYDWLPEQSPDIKIQNNISSSLDLYLAIFFLLALVASFVCGGLLVYLFCRPEETALSGQVEPADLANPNRWIPGIPEVMFKTESGQRIHLYDGCAGQRGVRRSDNEKYRVCAHCLNTWRKTVDAEVASYLSRPGNQLRADINTGTRWTCSCGRSRAKTD